MEYRNLGRTGVKVSSLCLGCMTFGSKTDPAESTEIIDRAIDAGINFFDTANVYGDGASEEMTGEALARNGKRNRIVLATKVHGRLAGNDPNAGGSSRRHIIEQCEISLKRLRTDWIDLYQMHRPQPDIPIDETLRALDDLIRAGKVRYIGSSTFAAWQVVEALWASKELGLNRFVSEQSPYHLLDRRIERELVPMAMTYVLAIIPWSPLASGFLTGKYRRGEGKPEGSRLQVGYQPQRTNPLFSDAGFDVLDGVVRLAEAKGCTPSQLALAWCGQQPGITSPIFGPRTLAQYEDNMGCLNVTVTAEDRAVLDNLVPPGSMMAPYYEANFGPHPFRW